MKRNYFLWVGIVLVFIFSTTISAVNLNKIEYNEIGVGNANAAGMGQSFTIGTVGDNHNWTFLIGSFDRSNPENGNICNYTLWLGEPIGGTALASNVTDCSERSGTGFNNFSIDLGINMIKSGQYSITLYTNGSDGIWIHYNDSSDLYSGGQCLASNDGTWHSCGLGDDLQFQIWAYNISQNQTQSQNQTISSGAWDFSLNNNLVAYYPFSQKSPTSDLATRRNNLTILGNPLNTANGCKIGNCWTDFSTTSFLNKTGESDWSDLRTKDFTINTWLNYIGGEDVMGALDWDNNGWLLAKYGNSWSFYADGDYRLISPNTINPNDYYMLTIIRNNSGMFLYVNNALESTSNITGLDIVGDFNFALGKRPMGSGGSPFQGSIDDTGLWYRSLSEAEINQLYNNGNGIAYPEVYLPLDIENTLNVNSSVWWNFMNGFNATHFVDSFGKLTISQSWLTSFITSLINYNYVLSLGFYPSSNPNHYINTSSNASTGNPFNQNLNTTNTPSFVGINITGNYIYNNNTRYSFADLNRTSAGGGNSSFNQSLTDSLYYSASNPSNFYNASTLPSQSGTSFKYYNLTTADVVTGNSTRYNATILSLPLTSGKTVSIECNLLVDSAAATTGIQLNSTVSATSSRRQLIEYYTSATAQAICQGTSETLNCSATSSAGTIVTPIRINIYTVQQNNSQFILRLKSEIANSNVYVRAGSWCRSTEF